MLDSFSSSTVVYPCFFPSFWIATLTAHIHWLCCFFWSMRLPLHSPVCSEEGESATQHTDVCIQEYLCLNILIEASFINAFCAFVFLPLCVFKACCGLEDFIVAGLISRPGDSEAPQCHAHIMQLGAISKLMVWNAALVLFAINMVTEERNCRLNGRNGGKGGGERYRRTVSQSLWYYLLESCDMTSFITHLSPKARDDYDDEM